MSNLQERLIESMLKDLQNIEEFDQGKILRKECSLLLKRVESAKKLFADDPTLLTKLDEIKYKVEKLKTN